MGDVQVDSQFQLCHADEAVAPNALVGDGAEEAPARVVVILDEAYFEFVSPQLRGDSVHWVRRFPNLVVLRTFSKAYGLAGLRVGYGIAQPALVDMLRRVRSPFTVTHMAQVAAALEDQDFLSRTIEINDRVRGLLMKGLTGLEIQSLESHTNFVLVKTGQGAALSRALEKHGLIVRPVDAYGLSEWVRISVGTEVEMERLLQAMRVELAT